MQIFNKDNSSKVNTFQNKIKLTWINQRPVIVKSTILQKVKNGKIVNFLPSQNLKLPINKPLKNLFFLTCQQTYEKIPLYTSTLSRLSYKKFVLNILKSIQVNGMIDLPGRFLPKYKLKSIVGKLKMSKRRRKKLPKHITSFVGFLGLLKEVKPEDLTDVNVQTRKAFQKFTRFIRFKVVKFVCSINFKGLNLTIPKVKSKIIKSKKGPFIKDFADYYYLTGLNSKSEYFNNNFFGLKFNELLTIKSEYLAAIKTRLQAQWKRKKRKIKNAK